MAAENHHYHHYHHHYHHHRQPTTTAACCCSCCCAQSAHPPPPDPLYQSMASHFCHPPEPYMYSPYVNVPHNAHALSSHQSHRFQTQPHQQTQQQFQRHHQQPQQIQPVVSSLLRRITALESSLHHRPPATSTPPFSPADAAARAIQIHFRAFLVRRSRTLRQLKELAFIKSTLSSLKISLSDPIQFDYRAFSRKAMDLLLKLDSIQGGDPMIRDGKRSISKELTRVIEYIEDYTLKRNEIASRAVKNVRIVGGGNKSRVLYSGQQMNNGGSGDLGGDATELVKKLRVAEEISEEEVEKNVEPENPSIPTDGKISFSGGRNGILVRKHGGLQSKLKKRVSFADTVNVSQISKCNDQQFSIVDANSSDGSGSIDEETEVMSNLCREIEEFGGCPREIEDDEEGQMGDGFSSRFNDGERNPRRMRPAQHFEINGQYQGQNGNLIFSAPVPLKMESKADVMRKRNGLKIVEQGP